jgi:hypothetical protein
MIMVEGARSLGVVLAGDGPDDGSGGRCQRS